MKPSQLLLLRSLAFNTPLRACNSCLRRQFRTLQPQQSKEQPTYVHQPDKPDSPAKRLQNLPEDPKDLILQPLGRPIGSPFAPLPGDNDPVDHRPFQQRKADFTNYDKHLERRKELVQKASKPYFRDWKNLKYANGKGWIANDRLWKGSLSLWMPNLRGRTLDKAGDASEGVNGLRDTCAAMKGKISVVGIFSRTWAENQVNTFLGDGNPELKSLIESSGGQAQIVEINVEQSKLSRAILRIFGERSLRSARRPEDWRNYFFLKEIPDGVKECIGVMNGSAGYVYLVDSECRIRWAGSGDATDQEKQILVKGLRKLIDERKSAFETTVKGGTDGKRLNN